MSTLRPLRDHIVVRPLADTPQGLIHIIEHNAKWRRGEVLAVGPGKRDKHGVPKPWGTRVGDVVQFSDVMVFPEFDTGTERVLVLQEADVCGVEVEGKLGDGGVFWCDTGRPDMRSSAPAYVPPRFERVL